MILSTQNVTPDTEPPCGGFCLGSRQLIKPMNLFNPQQTLIFIEGLPIPP